MNSEFISIVLCQVIFFFVFITIFFFTYAALTEQNVLKKQISFLIDQTVAPYLKFIKQVDQTDTATLIDKINGIKINKKSDDEVDSNNKQVITKAIKVLGIAVLIIIGIIFGLYHFSKTKNSGFFKSFSLKPVIIESLIILVFVGLTEYVFLTYFGARFISVDINQIKIAIIKKIKEYLNEPTV